MSTLEKTQLELHKAWDLIEKLEEENLALTKASRNHLTAKNNAAITMREKDERIRKLEHDNKFLRKLITLNTGLNMAHVGDFLKKQYDLNNDKNRPT